MKLCHLSVPILSINHVQSGRFCVLMSTVFHEQSEHIKIVDKGDIAVTNPIHPSYPIPSRPSIAITHPQLFQMRGPVVVVVALHQTPYSPLITTWCRCTRSCSDIVSCSTTMMLTICIGWSSLVGDLHVIGHRRGLCGDRVVGALAGYATASTFDGCSCRLCMQAQYNQI